MRQINSLITLLVVAAFVTFTVSCSKDGPAGATGPAGPAGPAGAAGAAGATGAAGPAGTANVIYSPWFNAKFSADVDQTDNTTILGYFFDTTITKLTATVLNTGELKFYMNLGTPTAPAVVALPYLEVGSNGGALTITPYWQVGGVELYANANVSTQVTGTGNRFQYRFVLIPGGTTARSSIDWNNYAEVKKYLNLKD